MWDSWSRSSVPALAAQTGSPSQGEYADAGITHFWRVEQEPTLAVHPFVLAGSVCRTAGVITGRGRAATPWGDIDLDAVSLGL